MRNGYIKILTAPPGNGGIIIMQDNKMIEGIRVFAPHQAAPDFVVASVIITPNDLVTFLKSNPDLLTEYEGKKQLKMQLLRSQGGKLYMKADTYKPGDKPTPTPQGDQHSDLPF